MERAERLVDIAGRCLDRGQLSRADRGYAAASQARPDWSVPWYNRGLVAKLERRWAASMDFNRRAAELDPNDQASWWNMGIAATATDDWPSARFAWSKFRFRNPAAATETSYCTTARRTDSGCGRVSRSRCSTNSSY